MFSAYLIYLFLHIHYDLIKKKYSLAKFITIFGIINGILSSSWMNLGINMLFVQVLKPFILTILSIFLTKFMLAVDIKKSIISFSVIGVGLAVGNASIPLIFYILGKNATPEVVAKDLFMFFIVNFSNFAVQK